MWIFFFFLILRQEVFWRLAVGIICHDKHFPMWLWENKTDTPTCWKQATQKISPPFSSLVALSSRRDQGSHVDLCIIADSLHPPPGGKSLGEKWGFTGLPMLPRRVRTCIQLKEVIPCFSAPWLFLQRPVPCGCGDSHSSRWFAGTQQMHSLDPLTIAGCLPQLPPWH